MSDPRYLDVGHDIAPQRLDVRGFTTTDADEWDRYVMAHPEATFFHLSKWRNVIERSFGHKTYYLLAERGGRIAGVLPLGHVRSRFFGNALISTPFCVYGGVIADADDVVMILEQRACELAEELGVDYLEMRNRTKGNNDWPTKDQYVYFSKDICSNSEKNLQEVPRKQRAMIRKGVSAGLSISHSGSIESLYALYSESVRNLGTPVFSKRYFTTLISEFRDDAQVSLVTHNSEPVCGVLSFRFRNEILPYYGGGTAAARDVKGNDFMYWEVMKQAAENGIEVFDYGRSKRDSGSFRFKKHWGFEEKPLFYQYHLVKSKEVPNLSPQNPRYQTLIRTWRRLPLRVTQLIGPVIARGLA